MLLLCMFVVRALGLQRTCAVVLRAPPVHQLSVVHCRADEDERKKQLLASLNAGMNSWKDFDSAEPKPPATKNAGKQRTKRKGKDGKVYLRDGPKRPAKATKFGSRQRRSDVADVSIATATAAAESSCRVRIEESKAGGKKITIVRGLEALLVRCDADDGPDELRRDVVHG